MAKPEVEVQFTFTLPIDESFLQHKTDAERKAKEAFVLELLRQGDISAGQGYLVLGFLSILIGKSRVGVRSDKKSLEQKFKIIGKLNSPECW